MYTKHKLQNHCDGRYMSWRRDLSQALVIFWYNIKAPYCTDLVGPGYPGAHHTDAKLSADT